MEELYLLHCSPHSPAQHKLYQIRPGRLRKDKCCNCHPWFHTDCFQNIWSDCHGRNIKLLFKCQHCSNTLKQLTLSVISCLACWPGWYAQDALAALTFCRGKLLKELHVVLICGCNSSLSHPAIKVVGITLSQEQMGFDKYPRSDLLWKFALISATDANSWHNHIGASNSAEQEIQYFIALKFGKWQEQANPQHAHGCKCSWSLVEVPDAGLK